jgi:hypothetical protein
LPNQRERKAKVKSVPSISTTYAQTGNSTSSNELGLLERGWIKEAA